MRRTVSGRGRASRRSAPFRPRGPLAPWLGWRRRPVPVFLLDLDNTLYDANTWCFPGMHQYIHGFLMAELDLDLREAEELRERYWRRYGTTLAGLMRHHQVDPLRFLEAIHPPGLADAVPPDPGLEDWLSHLPGPAFVFTNSLASHAARVLERLGVGKHVAGIFDMVHSGYGGKPAPLAYRRLLRQLRVPAWRCVFFDDSRINLRPARWMGMQTVWVHPRRGWPGQGGRDRRVPALQEPSGTLYSKGWFHSGGRPW